MKKMSDDPALWPENKRVEENMGLSGYLMVTKPDKLPKQKEKVFIICPIRQALQKTLDAITYYVQYLESKGYEVYWPYRDNLHQQTDKIGIQIITLNREKMIEADEIYIWYDKNSIGSVFDFGMLFLILMTDNKKRIRIINDYDIKPTPHKSFENVLLELRKQFGIKEDISGDLY